MSSAPDKLADVTPGAEFVARYSGPLLNYFLRRVRHHAQAEDLVQEVLLRVLRAGESEVIEHPESYVFKVAANLLKDLRRQEARHPDLTCGPPREDCAESIEDALVEERSPERVLLGEATLAQVLQALGELNEMTRNVFVLFRLEHMKQKDIAALYGIAQSTVEKHVMRAVVHLARRCATP
jgi:RNA polymerase sigma factor (sigma-70 family)